MARVVARNKTTNEPLSVKLVSVEHRKALGCPGKTREKKLAAQFRRRGQQAARTYVIRPLSGRKNTRIKTKSRKGLFLSVFLI
jgi:hypothetical protein